MKKMIFTAIAVCAFSMTSFAGEKVKEEKKEPVKSTTETVVKADLHPCDEVYNDYYNSHINSDGSNWVSVGHDAQSAKNNCMSYY